MRLVFGLVLLVGVALAGVAVYMAKDFFAQQQAQLAAAEQAKQAIVPTVGVMVVNKQMRYGQRLTKEDVKIVRWPEAAVPKGSFTTAEDLFPKGFDVQRAILRTMEEDEPILAAKVTQPGQDAGIASRLSPGMRAFTIKTDVTSGVSGFLRVGDRVDVYWTGGINGSGVTKRIFQGIRIIGINQSADEDRSGPVVAKTVTIEVTPQHVAGLAQAQESGRLSLSLVGADDVAIVDEDVETDLRTVLGIEEEVVVEAEQERVCTSKIRKGAEIIEIPIPCTN